MLHQFMHAVEGSQLLTRLELILKFSSSLESTQNSVTCLISFFKKERMLFVRRVQLGFAIVVTFDNFVNFTE